MDVDPPVTSNDGKPAFVRASVASDYESVPLPPDVTLRRDGKYPALCTDGGRFLAHRSIAASRRSPKVEALLDDLRKVLPEDRKALVFSQLKDSLLLISKVLVEEGIEHVKIVPGDSVIDRETAAERFRTDPKVQVFLLHAGQAAAGLTLTVARHVFLLEPFLSLGDEAQARSRCHRIGQTREVYSTTYYCKGTIEERLLAYRSMQESRDNVIDLTDEDDVTENLAAHTSAPSPAKMKFLFGLRSASDAPSAQSTSSGRRQSRMSVPAASRRGRAQRLAIPRHRRAGRMGTCSVVRSSSSSEDDSELSDSE
jgi:E3 ubiquitin-protein ligase SHPRH